MKSKRIKTNFDIHLLKLVTMIIFASHIFAAFSQNDSVNARDLTYLTSGGKLLPLQAIMDIRHYSIALDVDITKQSIRGSTTVSLNLSKKTDTILLDLIHLYTVTRIKVNQKAVVFHQKDDKIFILSPTGFETGNQKVTIEYYGIPPVAVKPPGMEVLHGPKISMATTGYLSIYRAKAEKCIFHVKIIRVMNPMRGPN